MNQSLPTAEKPPTRTAVRVVFADLAAAFAAGPFFIDEEGVGCWLGTDDPGLWTKGEVHSSERYALHLPTVDQHGRALPDEMVARFRQEAGNIGLHRCSKATGYWTLSGTGEVQQERVWILHSETAISEIKLRQLALRILNTCDQDAVAIEWEGRVAVLR
ncbi:MAG: hypothetical protein IPN20_21855 [Haliscomenobacter sp.]|nr:hypothetical protein [Haliscomenobacter sp.]